MISKYQQAANTRKRGLVGSITDRLVAGQGIGGSVGSGISETFKAKSTGIKEKFDPLNIAKMLTGNLGMALVGKITGRKSEDMEYFLNKGRKKGEAYRQVSAPDTKVGKVDTAFFTTVREGQRGSLQKGDNVATVAARLVNLLKTFYEKETLQRQLLHNFDEENEFEDQRRHEDLLKEIKDVKEKKLTKEEIQKLKSQQNQKEKMEVGQEPKALEKPSATPAPTPKTEAKTEGAKAPEIVIPTKPTIPSTTPGAPTVSSKPTSTVSPAKPEMPTAKVETPVVKPKVEASAPPVTATKTPTSGVSDVVKSAGKTTPMSGNKGLVLSALAGAGITSMGAQANILANVQKESNFKPRNEELPSAEKIFSMFGGPEVKKTKDGRPLNKSGNVVRFPTLQDAKDIVSAGPEAYFNKVYDGRKDLGNTEPGDGYKYRGRGFIQITGKSMYQAVGKELGIDLVSNPELANDPAIAAKIIPIFFKIKLRERKTDKTSLEDIGEVNSMVGSASVSSNVERKTLSAQILNEMQNTSGNQIATISNENQELKQKSSSNNVFINNTKTIINSGSNEQPQVLSVTSPDDYPLLATSPA